MILDWRLFRSGGGGHGVGFPFLIFLSLIFLGGGVGGAFGFVGVALSLGPMSCANVKGQEAHDSMC